LYNVDYTALLAQSALEDHIESDNNATSAQSASSKGIG